MTNKPFIAKNGLASNGAINEKVGTITGTALGLSSGDYFEFTPTDDTTFTFSDPASSGSVSRFALEVTGAAGTIGYQNITSIASNLKQCIPTSNNVSPLWADGNSKLLVLYDNGIGVLNCSTPGSFSSTDTWAFDGFLNTWTTSQATENAYNFNNDGTKFYFIDNSTVYQYTLSTPYQLNTNSYDSKSKSLTTSIKFLFFKPDGTKVFYGRPFDALIRQRTLSTAWDISTAGAETTYDAASQFSSSYSGNISSDGTKMIVGGGTTLYQYTLSTAWDVTTASYDSVSATTVFNINYTAISNDGTALAGGNAANGIAYYTLSTPWDLSTISSVSSYMTVCPTRVSQTGSYGVAFGDSGNIAYDTRASDTVYQYTLSEPYNFGTATLSSSQKDPGYLFSSISDVVFNPTGTLCTMFGLTGSTEVIATATLSTAWDITTATANSNVASTVAGNATLSWNDDGTVLHIRESNSTGEIHEHDCSANPYSVSGSTFNTTYTPSASVSAGYAAFYFNEAGTKLYVAHSGGFDSYTLSTAWDISTASSDATTHDAPYATAGLSSRFYNAAEILVMKAGNYWVFDTSGAGPDFTFTYPASVEWPGGTAPTAPAGGQKDLLEFVTRDGGTTYIGYQKGDNFS